MILYRFMSVEKRLKLDRDSKAFWHSNALDSIANSYIYFSSFEGLNDASERKVQVGFSVDKNKSGIRALRKDVNDYFRAMRKEENGHYLPSKQEVMNCSYDQLLQYAQQASDSLAYGFKGVAMRVCCFSKSCDEELMWGHYANGMRGICVEYVIELGREAFFEVRYVDEPVKLCVFDLSRMGHKSIQEVHRYKSKAWEYEQEIRSVYSKDKLKISADDYSSIIIGYRMTIGGFRDFMDAYNKSGLSCPLKVAYPKPKGYGICVSKDKSIKEIENILKESDAKKITMLESE